MQVLSVWLPMDPPIHGDAFCRLVASCARQTDTGPVTIEWQEEQHENHRIFRFHGRCREGCTAEAHDVVRAFVALVVVEWVVRVLEPELIRARVRREQEDHWKDVVPYVTRVLNECGGGPRSEQPSPRKAAMYRKVVATLAEHHDIHLHGLIRFRLKRERQDLYDAITLGSEEYHQEQEYQSFLQLLKHFVSEQEALCRVIHIVRPSPRRLLLYDEEGEEVRLEALEALLRLSGRDWRDEDFLLSALISLAPERVLLHTRCGTPEWQDVLDQVFGDRFSVCTACTHARDGCPLDSLLPAPYNT